MLPGKLGLLAAVSGLVLSAVFGCSERGELIRMTKNRDAVQVERDRLRRELDSRNARIAKLDRRVETLAQFGPDRPADLFAPVKIEIVSRSGGIDLDGKPGDDAITVYIRPIDVDGDAVKVPGLIRVQLLDNSVLGEPRVLGLCVFDDPGELRRMWYSKFGTNHFTAKCRFAPGKKPPEIGRVLVSVEFTDYLTGKTFTATKEVDVAPRG